MSSTIYLLNNPSAQKRRVIIQNDGLPRGDGLLRLRKSDDEVVALVSKTRKASISMIQRHLRIGYNRAARIIELMVADGIVGPADGAKPREVLVGNYDEMP